MDETTPKNSSLSRREALKTIIAAGGALAAAASLPGQWTKPQVEAGVIPAHAQASLPALTVTVVSACETRSVFFQADLSYNDPAGLVTNDALVTIYTLPCHATLYDGNLGGANHNGNGTTGTFGIDFINNNECYNNTVDQLCVQLTVGSRSASDCGTFGPCPE